MEDFVIQGAGGEAFAGWDGRTVGKDDDDDLAGEIESSGGWVASCASGGSVILL